MGYMSHNVIVVTSWSRKDLTNAINKAIEFGLYVVCPSDETSNGISSFMICPDGSKEGWDESNYFDELRKNYISYLNSIRYEDNSSPLSWFEARYGSDDRSVEIISHAWEIDIE